MSRLGLEKYVSIKRTAERAVGSNSDTVRIHRITGIFAGMALLPFAVSLGLGFYIVLFGMTAAFVAGERVLPAGRHPRTDHLVGH